MEETHECHIKDVAILQTFIVIQIPIGLWLCVMTELIIASPEQVWLWKLIELLEDTNGTSTGADLAYSVGA
jgi:hypothetical protein